MLAEEVIVSIARRHDLDLVALHGRELHGGGLLEIDPQPQHIPREGHHGFVVLRRDSDPAYVPHLHRDLPD